MSNIIRTNIAILTKVDSRLTALAIDDDIRLATPTGVNLKPNKLSGGQC